MKKVLFIASAVLLTFVAGAQGKEGWTNLFDGKSLAGWEQLGGQAEYRIEDGAIVGITVPNTRNSFLVTKKRYSDFVLELEVKIMDTTSNSGIQFRSQYDPSGDNGRGRVFGYQYELDPSVRKWTAGIYDEGRREWLYPMTLNPAGATLLPVGVYNKVRIACSGNETRTWINDVPAAFLVDTVDLEGFIALQVHSIGSPEFAGRKIYWRNIRIREGVDKSLAFPSTVFVRNMIPNRLSRQEKEQGWKLLFDGVSTKGWRGAYKPGFPKKGWTVADGTLNVLASTGGESTNGGDIVTTEQFGSFDLTFDFKLTHGANSGVKYFVTLTEKNSGSAIGLEYQLLDDTLHPDARQGRDGNRTLASLYDLIKAEKQKRFIGQPGKWNTGRIIVYPNNHVEHYLNGIKVLEYDRGSAAFRELVAISKYKVWDRFGEAAKGHILLQDHGNAVSFRSIKIRELK